MRNSRTQKFMFSKIKKIGIGICIPIPPIYVEQQMLIFGLKLEYIFQYYSYSNSDFVHPNREIKLLRNIHMPFPLVYHCQMGPKCSSISRKLLYACIMQNRKQNYSYSSSELSPECYNINIKGKPKSWKGPWEIHSDRTYFIQEYSGGLN